MKFAWTSDIHLNQVDKYNGDLFFDKVNNTADALLLTGDICDGSRKDFERLAENINIPVYFVLGNHDFYYNHIHNTTSKVRNICRDYPHLNCLSISEGVVGLDNVALIGADGWGDARYGDLNTNIELWDFTLIKDLKPAWDLSRAIKSTQPLHTKLRELGKQSAAQLDRVLNEALIEYDNVLILTHIPPFPEAAWHKGNLSQPDFLPYFSCYATGEVLETTMKNHPDKGALILCGHTHSRGTAEILPNLHVWTAKAEYRFPEIEMYIELKNIPNIVRGNV